MLPPSSPPQSPPPNQAQLLQQVPYMTRKTPCYSFLAWIWPLPFCPLILNCVLSLLALFIVFASSSLHLMPYPCIYCLAHTTPRAPSDVYLIRCTVCWLLPPVHPLQASPPAGHLASPLAALHRLPLTWSIKRLLSIYSRYKSYQWSSVPYTLSATCVCVWVYFNASSKLE